jgi:hypothetical protein
VAQVLGRAHDYGIGARLLGDPGQLVHRVPIDRAELSRDPQLCRPAADQLLQLTTAPPGGTLAMAGIRRT